MTPAAITHPDVAWAAQHMPLLRDALDPAHAHSVAPALRGLRIAMCLHIEPKTAVLCHLLTAAGAQVWLTGSPGTTRADVAEWLSGIGVHVHAAADDDAPRVDDVLAGDPHLLLDNGADLTQAVLDAGPRPPHFLGGTEETTTGALLLRRRPDPVTFPVVVINDSYLKLLVENRFGVGQSVVQGFMNATNRMLPGVRATVIGYGPCGRGVAQTLRSLGARVAVADTDPYRRLEAAMEGHDIGPARSLLARTDLLFLATGTPNVLDSDDVAVLPDGVVVSGVGHQPWEVDLGLLGQRLEQPAGPDAARQTALHDTFIRPDGRRTTVLARTRMINLVAAGGNPIEAMDLGLTLQARSLALVATGGARPGVHAVPDDLDRAVAEAFVATLENA